MENVISLIEYGTSIVFNSLFKTVGVTIENNGRSFSPFLIHYIENGVNKSWFLNHDLWTVSTNSIGHNLHDMPIMSRAIYL